MRRKVVVDLCSASVAGSVGSAECIAVYCKGAIYLLPTQSGALELFSLLVFEDGNSFWNIGVFFVLLEHYMIYWVQELSSYMCNMLSSES